MRMLMRMVGLVCAACACRRAQHQSQLLLSSGWHWLVLPVGLHARTGCSMAALST